MILKIILGIFLLILISGVVWSYCSEKKLWNNGFCYVCGTPWKYFDTNSQGGRGYCCDSCQDKIWISWVFDRKHLIKKEIL